MSMTASGFIARRFPEIARRRKVKARLSPRA
jgi:hypothetical protein